MSNLVINNKAVSIAFTEVDNTCLRVTVYPSKVSDPFRYINGHYLSDFAKSLKPSITVNSDTDEIIEAGQFSIKIKSKPLVIEIKDASGNIVQELSFDEVSGDVTFPLGNKEIFGLGQGFASPMDRRGQVYNMRRHGQQRDSVYEYATISAIPYIISREGWGLFFHEPIKGVIDLSGDVGKFTCLPKVYRDIFIMNYDKPETSATIYYKLTGKSLIPPKYAFGYQQSFREMYHNGESIVMPTAQYMRDNDIPCDLLIYLGRYVEYGWNTYTHNGMFEFNEKSFPNPPETIQKLHDLDYKVALHITETASALHGNIDDDDVNPLEYDHVKNFWDRHVELYNYSNIDAWWPDDGDELDIAAFTSRYKMYYDGTKMITPNKRGFYMSRNSYCGDTKYGGIIWSGDVLSKWATLKNHIFVGLNVAMSLSPYWGSDIGGFFVTEEYSGELYIRWFEYSVFNPMFRSHGRHSFLHNPWGWNIDSVKDIPDEKTNHSGNNMSDAVLPDYRVEPICKEYIELRYKLVPYIYSLAKIVHEEGIPFMRPMWFSFADDEKASTCQSQYMFGDSMLVNPVTEKGVIDWTTYLPEGNWYDFFTNEIIEGGRDITVPVELKDIPVYIKAGTILPMGEVKQFIGDDPINPLDDIVNIQVYEGCDASYVLYEDDGISNDYLNNDATYTEFMWDESNKKLTVSGKSSQISGKTRKFNVFYINSKRKDIVTCVYDKL